MSTGVLEELEVSSELAEELADIVGGVDMEDGGKGNPWADWRQRPRG